jgi:signal transduction histidine kinase
MNGTPRRILIVDDSETDREIYRRLLRNVPNGTYDLACADSGAEGLAAFREEPPDCILLDYSLPDLCGVEFLGEITDRAGAIPVPVVMLTGQGNESVAVEAMKRGAQDYLTKGVLTSESLGRAIENAIEKWGLQRSLQKSNDDLRSKNARLTEMRDTAHEFVDHVSHEFRTPLTVIREFASIMYDGLAGETTDEQREYLEIIANRVDDLGTLVADMLDTSKLEAGMLGISRADCRMEHVVAQLLTTLERRAAASKAHLEVDIPTDLPPVYCDAEKIRRVITNLVINALKFCGEPGEVRLQARADPANHEVTVAVIDNGPGISEEGRTALFERFRQLDGQVRRQVKGFGLGLSMAKELVTLNLGDISVASKPGEGSTFSFTIPYAERRPLLRRFLARSTRSRGRSTCVALLHLTAEMPSDPPLLDELEHLVQQQSRRSDLLFRVGAHE